MRKYYGRDQLANSRSRGISLVTPPGHEQVQRKLRADPLLLGFLVHLSRRGGKLDSHARIVLEKGDLLVVLATATFVVHEITEVMQVFGFDDAPLESIVKLRLFVDKNLRFVANNDQAGSRNRLVVELLSRQKAVAAN